MNLKTQIISSIVSLIYGYIFSCLVNINYKFLFSKKLWFKIMMNIIFIIDCGLLYFLILKNINNGYIHYYLYIMIAIGFSFGFVKTKFLREWIVKLYNKFMNSIKKGSIS